MKKNNKILFILGTHGDERIGSHVIKILNQGNKEIADYIIGNPKAFEKNKRFIDVDLNRVYPGNEKSKYYEEKQAFKNFQTAKQYKYVIDIHEAKKSKHDFIIIPKNNITNNVSELLNFLDIGNVVLWPSSTGSKIGPIAQVIDNCIEIEFGAKGMRSRNLKIKKFLDQFIYHISNKKKAKRKKNYFFVYDKLDSNKFNGTRINDFKKTTFNGEAFFPLLVDQYLTSGIKCYKMRKIKM